MVRKTLSSVPGILWPTLALVLAESIKLTLQQIDPMLQTWWVYLLTLILWGVVLIIQQLWPEASLPKGFGALNPPPGAASIPEVEHRYEKEQARLRRQERIRKFIGV